MNVLKKSALALAVASMATAASAATITTGISHEDGNTWVLSEQGVAVGEVFATDIGFTLKLENQHNSGSEFEVIFSDKADLTKLGLTAGSNPLTQLDTDGNGNIAFVNNAGNAGIDASLFVRVGTADFTFKTVEFDAAKNSLRFISEVGQPLKAGAAIQIRIGTTSASTVTDEKVVLKGAAELEVKTYKADDEGGAFIEDAQADISSIAEQFSLALHEGTSELVDRVDPRFFAEEVFYNDDLVVSGATATISHVLDTVGGETQDVYELRTTTNEGAVRLVNNKNLKALADITQVDLTLKGDFDGYTTAATELFTFAGEKGASSATALAYELTDGNGLAISEAGDSYEEYRFALDNDTGAVLNLENEFDIAGKVTYTGFAGNANVVLSDVVLAETQFGEWILDQAIINVPYMPIGYKATRGLDSVFEISNRGNVDAAIKVKAFDQDGNQYGPVALLDDGKVEHDGYAKAKTVVKVSADDVLKTFGLKDGAERKMNITFMIDAKRADIDLVPYYNDVGVRSPIINSQYKDGAERR
jgi:hypothetical protein